MNKRISEVSQNRKVNAYVALFACRLSVYFSFLQEQHEEKKASSLLKLQKEIRNTLSHNKVKILRIGSIYLLVLLIVKPNKIKNSVKNLV